MILQKQKYRNTAGLLESSKHCEDENAKVKEKIGRGISQTI